MSTPGPEAVERSSARNWAIGRAVAAATSWLAQASVSERDRWVLWTPVALGIGISVYFALRSEPPLWVGPVATSAWGLAYLMLRRWPAPALVAATAILLGLGFAAAQLRVAIVSAPIMERELTGVRIEGRACEIGMLPKGYRVYVDRLSIPGLASDETPMRVRLRVNSDAAIIPAQSVSVTARLGPISGPVAPAAFDFQRDLFFERVGGVGFAFGTPQTIADGEPPGWLSDLPCRLSGLRLRIGQRIRAVLGHDTGAIGVALVTGDQGAISKPVLQDMRDSGLAHLLSISGLHIGLVAGILFVTVRRALCLFPRVALYHPIKKWGAVVALIGTLFYVVLAGAPVPTVRAFIMAGMFLMAVVLDRTAISMPPVAWAAIVVLLVSPEELIGPSFQMSFAAVVALVAAYESTQGLRLRWRAETGWFGRAGLYVAGVLLTSLIATLATSPYSIFHFNRIASYGVIANMAAVPLTGLWIMPWAVLAVLLMPFGLEHLALVPMGWGIDVIIEIADAIAGWPGAVRTMPTMPLAGLVLVTLGGLWLCLWQRPWRFAAVPLILLGMATVALSRAPSVLVAGDGRLFAVADSAGGLLLSSERTNEFIAEKWLQRSGQEEAEPWPTDGYGAGGRLACDALGCIYRIHGRTIALVQQSIALSEDCAVADVVVSFEPIRTSCRPTVAAIDWFDLWRNGAYAIWVDPDGTIDIESVQERRGERPWVPRRDRP